MKNLWNIDLWSVRPAELHSATERQRTATIQKDSGQTGRWAHRQDAYVRFPPIRMNAQLTARVIPRSPRRPRDLSYPEIVTQATPQCRSRVSPRSRGPSLRSG